MKPMTTKPMARLAVLLAFGATFALPVGAAAQEVIRIGCPTKTYFPTILATVAKEKGLFEKEGLRPEITIYRAGGGSAGRHVAQARRARQDRGWQRRRVVGLDPGCQDGFARQGRQGAGRQ